MTANALAEAYGGVLRVMAGQAVHLPGRPAVRSRLAEQLRRAGRGCRSRTVVPDGAVVYQAAAALPHPDRGRAAEALRNQLRIMAVAGGLTPDWTTLALTGPTEVTGTGHGATFEWTGRVTVRGPSPSTLLLDPDDFPDRAEDDATMPFRVDGTWHRPASAVHPEPGSEPEEVEG